VTKLLAFASRHLILHQGFLFTEINMTVVPHSPYLSPSPPLKIKLRCCHFDATEVIEPESQTLLNSFTEHDFQNAFKKWQKR
jgi:hypothetical protein